jgi:hypothetical protein
MQFPQWVPRRYCVIAAVGLYLCAPDHPGGHGRTAQIDANARRTSID